MTICQSPFTRLVTAALFCSLAGCASFQDLEYETGQKWRAMCAYDTFKHECETPVSYHYGCGWKAGYYDVMTGGCGEPPIVPPNRYWKPCQTYVHCDEGRNQWYSGFQDGAAYAKRTPNTHYIKLWMPPCPPCKQCGHVQPPPVEMPYEPEIQIDQFAPIEPNLSPSPSQASPSPELEEGLPASEELPALEEEQAPLPEAPQPGAEESAPEPPSDEAAIWQLNRQDSASIKPQSRTESVCFPLNNVWQPVGVAETRSFATQVYATMRRPVAVEPSTASAGERHQANPSHSIKTAANPATEALRLVAYEN